MVLGPEARRASPGSDGRGEDTKGTGGLLDLDFLGEGGDHSEHDGEGDGRPEGGHDNAGAERGDEHDAGD